jgi:hypothetical protein
MMECGEGCDLGREGSHGGDDEIGLIGRCRRRQVGRRKIGRNVEGGGTLKGLSVGIVIVTHGSVKDVKGVDEAAELRNGDG